MKKLAILGGTPSYKKHLEPQWPVFSSEEIKNLGKVLESLRWSRFGSFERNFSESFAKFQGGKYAITTTSGMTALYSALKALDVKEGDEVIISAFPQPPALAICYIGAVPIFVDISSENLCIDPEKIEEKITKKTKAIIAIHTHNTMAEIDKILAISKKHKIPLIEDCAHAHGMKFNGVGAGYIGDIGVFSFEQSKVMTCGDGGLITTNNPKYMNSLLRLTNLGNDLEGKKDRNILGWNLRMTEFHAAILSSQLKRFPDQMQKKLKNIRYFEERLNEFSGLSCVIQNNKIENPTGFLYSLIYEKKHFSNIPFSLFIQSLRAEGLPVRTRQLSYDTPEVKNYLATRNLKTSCPKAEDIVNNSLFTLPHEIFLSDIELMDNIIEVFSKVKSLSISLKKEALKSKIKDKLKKVIFK